MADAARNSEETAEGNAAWTVDNRRVKRCTLHAKQWGDCRICNDCGHGYVKKFCAVCRPCGHGFNKYDRKCEVCFPKVSPAVRTDMLREVARVQNELFRSNDVAFGELEALDDEEFQRRLAKAFSEQT